ncbi:HlyD family efflux transporter periplasmic adaptor subunit [Aliiroseovarius sp. S2029]|uniref:efflux RND transporter periplasmic adaptor subunit n=1 Tax=Aliiroseovarius sp. S2029 TaxID=2936988 RepID=UPI0020BF5CD7|nr:HlyD family efflux transporter periplasmic adaptor subunit [Aliiroseovarius sp. S2029]MCK8483437.1 HlyD family efflux transporter periplasmic adaptor subunit [Aliiroseovarius sp. S2029]
MRFLGRSLTGLFLLAATLGLLAMAGSMINSAIKARAERDSAAPGASERIFSANVMTVTAGTLTPVMTAYGELSSRRALDVRALTGGTVTEMAENFQTGGVVQQGDKLLRIDPTDFEFSLELAKTDLSQAKAELRDARAALELARDDLNNATRQADLREAALTRQRDLVTRGVGTEAAVETAALAASAAQQAVLGKRQSVITAQARVSTAEAALRRSQIQLDEAQRRLDETLIHAEIGGILTDVSVLRGGVVAANEKIGRIIDPSALEVRFRVSAAQYARLLDDQGRLSNTDITVRLDAAGLDLIATGRIDRESADVGEGQTGRQIFATLDPSPGMRPGDFVTVTVDEPQLDGTVLLPASALNAQNEVLVLGPEDRLSSARVELLRRQGNDVIVRATALEGREIVTERTPALGAGIRIRPVRTGQPPAPEPQAEMVTLEPERLARLRSFVEGNDRMPEAARERILAQLDTGALPADTLARLEQRMGN